MKIMNYNFTDMVQTMFTLKNNQSTITLNRIKNELNKFFKDSNCEDVIFTKNTDKLFFGMCVMPYIKPDMTTEILSSNEKYRINRYYLEIDSKILEIGLTARELTACLLHEIGHMVNDSIPVENLRKNIDVYLMKTNDHLSLSDSVHYNQLLAYGIKDSLRKTTSLFFKKDEEIAADEFVVNCGFGRELESAVKKIVSSAGTINREVGNKLIVLHWTLRLYKDVKFKRIGALRSLNKIKAMEASVLEKREMDSIIRSLQMIDDDGLIQESVNNILKKINKSYRQFKYKGIRILEDELFEYQLRIKNVDEQDEALIILRELNTRLSIIDDYICSEKDLSESEKDRWFELANRYREAREELSKKTTYDEKYYGLFVKTPIIKSRYDL